MNDVVGTGKEDVFEVIRKDVSDLRRDLSRLREDAAGTVAKRVNAQPLRSLAIAMAIGFVAGLAIKR